MIPFFSSSSFFGGITTTYCKNDHVKCCTQKRTQPFFAVPFQGKLPFPVAYTTSTSLSL